MARATMVFSGRSQSKLAKALALNIKGNKGVKQGKQNKGK